MAVIQSGTVTAGTALDIQLGYGAYVVLSSDPGTEGKITIKQSLGSGSIQDTQAQISFGPPHLLARQFGPFKTPVTFSIWDMKNGPVSYEVNADTAQGDARYGQGVAPAIPLPFTARAIRRWNDSTSTSALAMSNGSSIFVGPAGAVDPVNSVIAYAAPKFFAKLNKLGNMNLIWSNKSVSGSVVASAVGAAGDFQTGVTAAGQYPFADFVGYGANDGTPGAYHAGQTYDGVYPSMVKLIKQIQAGGGDAIIFTTSHPHTDRYPWTTVPGSIIYPAAGVQIPGPTKAASVFIEPTFGVPASYRHYRVNQAIRDACRDAGGICIDLEPYWFAAVKQYGQDALFNPADFIHPNLFAFQKVHYPAVDAFVGMIDVGTLHGSLPQPRAGGLLVKVNSTTLANQNARLPDADLGFFSGPNMSWKVWAELHLTTPTAADFQVAYTAPAGSVGRFKIVAPGMATTIPDGDVANLRSAALGGYLTAGGNGDSIGLSLEGYITVGATGGRVGIDWAPFNLNAGNTIVYDRSSLRYEFDALAS